MCTYVTTYEMATAFGLVFPGLKNVENVVMPFRHFEANGESKLAI